MNDPLSLIFNWPVRNAIRLAFPLLLLVSILAHLVGLMVFQLRPLQETILPRRAATVYFLPPSENALPRIAASDPALFSPATTEERGLWRLPSSDYEPSFDAHGPHLAPLPAPAAAVSPSVMEAGPTRQLPLPSIRPAHVAMIPTRVALGGDLSGWTFSLPETTAFLAPTRQSLVPIEFLVAIEPSGRFLHAIPLTSSGYAPLDRQAIEALMTGRVLPPEGASADLTWGSATFFWGGDVVRKSTQ